MSDLQSRLANLRRETVATHEANDAAVMGVVRNINGPARNGGPTSLTALAPGETFADRFGVTAAANFDLGEWTKALLGLNAGDEARAAISSGHDASGGYLVPQHLASQIFEGLRAANSFMRAGAQVVPVIGPTKFAVITTDPTASHRLELGEVSATDPGVGLVDATPRSVAALVRVSREVVEDAANLGALLTAALGRSIAAEMDRAAVLGSGAGGEPTGLAIRSGVTSLAVSGALDGWSDVLDLRKAMLIANAPAPTSLILSATDADTLDRLEDGDGNPLDRPVAVRNLELLPTSKLEGSTRYAVLADFKEVLIALRSDIRVEVVRERWAETMEVGLLAHARWNLVTPRVAAIGVLTGITS